MQETHRLPYDAEVNGKLRWPVELRRQSIMTEPRVTGMFSIELGPWFLIGRKQIEMELSDDLAAWLVQPSSAELYYVTGCQADFRLLPKFPNYGILRRFAIIQATAEKVPNVGFAHMFGTPGLGLPRPWGKLGL